MKLRPDRLRMQTPQHFELDNPVAPRIAVVSAGELFGGVERQILDCVGELESTGAAQVLVVLFHDGELAARLRAQGARLSILRGERRAFLGSIVMLTRLLKEERIPIVHAHGYKAIVACALARCRASFAVVKTEHGLPEASRGWGWPSLLGRLYTLLDTAATRACGATVCYVTEELRVHFQSKHFGLPAQVVRNGVAALDMFTSPHPVELSERAFRIGILGRLEPVKGHAVAIEALARMHDDDVHLYILGEGSMEAPLRSLVARWGLSERVFFLGFRRDPYAFIAHCHTLLMPSMHEGLPYTLLEAMALGTPVIASRVGGLAETLQDGDTGLLVPAGDAEALSCAIARLRSDPALAKRIAANAAGLQRSLFSLDRMAASYLELYRQLAPSARGQQVQPGKGG